MATKVVTAAGGLAYSAPFGQQDNLTFQAGAWTYPGNYSVNFATTIGNATVGVGNLATLADATTPFCGLTLHNRVYMGAGQQFLLSSNNDPTGWEQQDVGAGFVGLTSQYGVVDNVYGLASFQGQLAVYGRYSTQIWTVNADPLQFSLQQTLANTGTLSMLSVQSLGDYDVLALNDAGFWSLRVRELTLNGEQIDIGAAVNPVIQQQLAGNTALGYAACAVVEPLTNRYWCYFNGLIWVLTYSRTAEIQAWSTYVPTDNVGVRFTPIKFVVYNGQVYCRGTVGGTDYLFQYGGANNATYDATLATVQIPWTAGQGRSRTPGTKKVYTAVDYVLKGAWTMYFSADYGQADIKKPEYQVAEMQSEPSPQLGTFPVKAEGTHCSILATTTDGLNNGLIPTLSSLIIHFQGGDEHE